MSSGARPVLARLEVSRDRWGLFDDDASEPADWVTTGAARIGKHTIDQFQMKIKLTALLSKQNVCNICEVGRK